MQVTNQYTRFCPGEEHIRISDAVCYGRRRVNFPKCAGCQFNDDEKAARQQKRVVAHGLVVKQIDTGRLDVLFESHGVRGACPEVLNEEAAWQIGFASGSHLKAALRGIDRSDPEMSRIVVGRDGRASSDGLARALIEGARASGVGVLDIGMVDTPQLAFAVNTHKCCGGIQTTGSRSPAPFNGFKIYGIQGRILSADTGLHDIRLIAGNTSPHDSAQRGALAALDLSTAYRGFHLGFLDLQRWLRIAVDASNGMAGRWLPILFGELDRLDCDVLNGDCTTAFAHDPDPLVEQHLQLVRQRVGEVSADFGVCFDGDADRCVMIDETGQPIPGDLMTALLADYFLQREPGSTVVYDAHCSRVVPETIAKQGGTPYRSRAGHAFMNKALTETSSVFGGDTRGRFYFKDHWCCSSAMLALTHTLNIVSRARRPLSALIDRYRKYCSIKDRQFISEDRDGMLRRLAEHYSDAKIDFLDGLTIQYPAWWFNLRKSGSGHLLSLNLEANTAALADEKIAELSRQLGPPLEPRAAP